MALVNPDPGELVLCTHDALFLRSIGIRPPRRPSVRRRSPVPVHEFCPEVLSRYAAHEDYVLKLDTLAEHAGLLMGWKLALSAASLSVMLHGICYESSPRPEGVIGCILQREYRKWCELESLVSPEYVHQFALAARERA